ncbi:MAG: hypothetical protein ABFD69_00810 [Candidatus Sumerlaeia bacterium]
MGLQGTLLNFFLLFSMLCVLANDSLAQPNETASSILEKFAENQERQKKIWFIFSSSSKSTAYYTHPYFVKFNGTLLTYDKGEYRYDGTRIKIIFNTWGNLESADKNVSEKDARYNSNMYDGQKIINYTQASGDHEKRDHAFIDDSNNDSIHARSKEMANRGGGSFLRGYLDGNRTRIDELLRQDANLRLLKQREVIGGASCFVVTAHIPQGDYKVWFDPSHGYNYVQVEISRKNPNFYPNSKNVMKPGTAASLQVKNVKCELVDGIWIPAEATFFMHNDWGGGQWSEGTTNYKSFSIRLDPDFDKDNAFVMDDVRPGSIITRVGVPSVEYIWDGDAMKINIDKKLTKAIVNQANEFKKEKTIQLASLGEGPQGQATTDSMPALITSVTSQSQPSDLPATNTNVGLHDQPDSKSFRSIVYLFGLTIIIGATIVQVVHRIRK